LFRDPQVITVDTGRKLLAWLNAGQDGPAPAAQPAGQAAPAGEPSDWDVANKRLRAVAGRLGKAAGLNATQIGEHLRALIVTRYNVDSSTKCTADQLGATADLLDNGTLSLVPKAEPAAAQETAQAVDDIPDFDDPLPAQVDDPVVLSNGRAINQTTGETLAAPTDDDAHGNKDASAFAEANAVLMAALKAAFPGQPQPVITGLARNIAHGRFGCLFDQVTTAGRLFLAGEIQAKRFDTLKLAQAPEVANAGA
jgi:hypothetical protein